MGGHGAHAHPNMNNIQQTDDEMLGQIQRTETIKHMPNHWHMEFFDVNNMYKIVGGAPTVAYGVIGAAFSQIYYMNAYAHMSPHFYVNNLRTYWRLSLGMSVGLWIGYMQFGDRQRLHNAWVAERLRKRYPECMELHNTDMWRFKNVKAPQEYYRWA